MSEVESLIVGGPKGHLLFVDLKRVLTQFTRRRSPHIGTVLQLVLDIVQPFCLA